MWDVIPDVIVIHVPFIDTRAYVPIGAPILEHLPGVHYSGNLVCSLERLTETHY
jgi:hypothetical protein